MFAPFIGIASIITLLINVKFAEKPLILTGQKQRIFGIFFQPVIYRNPLHIF